MRTIGATTLFAISTIFCFTSLAQNGMQILHNDHAETSVSENDAEHPCITLQEYEFIQQECLKNMNDLHIEPIDPALSKTQTVLEYWPVKASANLNDCSFYRVSAYVDQDQNAGTISDWNCGTKTYDGHKGTDISTWPFNFYKMDNDLVEVIAAAPGIIIAKHDGEFDRNCSGNNLTANYIMIQHQDGSQALYWHMKMNSVTSKIVGDAVVAGEYLGVVGSSGSSSGPHLHFEVWSGNTVATRIDPFSGTCNSLNASTWWINQKTHKETSIVKASVHSTDAVFPACPTTETPNEQYSFAIPYQGAGLPAGYAKFYIFIRDEVNGLNADLKILNPDGSTYLSWNYASSSDNGIRTFSWSKLLPVTPGTYTFQAIYNGTTCSSDFVIEGPAGIVEQTNNNRAKIYPNPSNGNITLELQNSAGDELEIYNSIGQSIYISKLTNNKTELSLSVDKGIYLYQIKSNGVTDSSGKLVVE